MTYFRVHIHVCYMLKSTVPEIITSTSKKTDEDITKEAWVSLGDHYQVRQNTLLFTVTDMIPLCLENLDDMIVVQSS